MGRKTKAEIEAENARLEAAKKLAAASRWLKKVHNFLSRLHREGKIGVPEFNERYNAAYMREVRPRAVAALAAGCTRAWVRSFDRITDREEHEADCKAINDMRRQPEYILHAVIGHTPEAEAMLAGRGLLRA